MEPEGIIEAIQRVYFSPIVFFPLKDSRGSTLFLFAVMYSKTGSLPRLMAFNAQRSNCCSWLLTSLHAHTCMMGCNSEVCSQLLMYIRVVSL